MTFAAFKTATKCPVKQMVTRPPQSADLAWARHAAKLPTEFQTTKGPSWTEQD